MCKAVMMNSCPCGKWWEEMLDEDFIRIKEAEGYKNVNGQLVKEPPKNKKTKSV